MSEEKAKPSRREICHVCGGTTFTAANIVTGSYLKIVPKDAGFLGRAFGGWYPSVRVCDTCGNVQMFVDKGDK